MNRSGMHFILSWFLAISFLSKTSRAAPFASTGNESGYPAGAEIRSERIHFRWIAPADVLIRRELRKNSEIIEMRPFRGDDFLMIVTSFVDYNRELYRKKAELLSAPCPSVDLPAADEFRIETRCSIAVAGNTLEKRILWIATDNRLIAVYLTYRKDPEKESGMDRLLQSILPEG